MVKKSLQPQEIQVWYILPALRKELTLEMKKLGLDQKTISKIIGVTEAAVSQYIKEKRANEVQFDDNTKEEIRKSAQLITQNGKLLFQEMQRLLYVSLQNKVICKSCFLHNNLPETCTICLDKKEGIIGENKTNEENIP